MRRLLLTPLLLIASQAYCLEELADSDMASMTAQDGLSLSLGSSVGLSADQIKWVTDDNGLNDGSCAGGTAGQHACTLISTIKAEGVGGDFYGNTTIDVGVDGSGNGLVALSTSWGSVATPAKVSIGGVTFNTPTWNASANSLGQMALIGYGSITMSNQGIFNNGGKTAEFSWDSTSDLIYRQGAAGSSELSFADLKFKLDFTDGAAAGHNLDKGKLALDGSGILFETPFADIDFTFDLAFKENSVDFDRTGRSHLLRFGWQGGLINATQKITSGGFGYNPYMDGPNTFEDYDGASSGIRSEGIGLLSEWDFDSDFSLIIGEAGGNRTYLDFTDWEKLGGPSAGAMFRFPIIFDVVQGATAPAGLCVGNFTSGVANQTSCTASGGEFIEGGLSAGDAAFAVLVRDAYLKAFSTRIEVVDPVAAGATTPIDWGVLFTYGKLDANIYMRPQGRGDGAAVTMTNTGLRTDVTLVAQSPDAWRRANSSTAAVRNTAGDGWRSNTHFMVVDTGSPIGSGQTGVGFVNGDIIYKARDLFIRVTDGDSAYPDLPGGLWLQTDNLAQYRFRGIFGGGDLADLSYSALTKVSLIDVNLETDRFIFTLNPLPVDGATGAAPIGFNGLLDFNGNSYFRVGEVSSPQSKFYVDDVQGRIAWRNGSMAIISGQNTSSGLPQLSIANDLDIGSSAHFGGAPGEALIGTVGFGTEDFGRLALPGGTWNSEIIVEIPN